MLVLLRYETGEKLVLLRQEALPRAEDICREVEDTWRSSCLPARRLPVVAYTLQTAATSL